MRFFATTLLLTIVVGLSATAQTFRPMPVEGVVGRELAIPFTGLPLASGGTLTVEGNLKLSNPTIFLPKLFERVGPVQIEYSDLESLSDTLYRFRLVMRSERDIGPSQDLVALRGEVLAGNDTLLVLSTANLIVNDSAATPDTAVISVRSIGTPLPYIRFATLDAPYPNPAQIGQEIIWGYRIDRRSDVTFRICDLLGQTIHFEKLGVLDPGVYLYRYTPDFTFPSGTFWAQLLTNSGEAAEPFTVLR